MTMQADPAGLLGARVVTIDGEDVGVIGRVYQEDRTGMVAWVRVSSGPPGIPDCFVPLAGVERTEEGVKVPFSKPQIAGCPQFDADGQLSEAQVAELERHYGLTSGDTPA
jgi:hypothetical protein